MIPKSIIENSEIRIDTSEQTSDTYELQLEKIQGRIKELKSIEQFVYKVLSTEQYEYPIYSFNYGIRLDDLLGKNSTYVKIELKRRIRECLLKDSRIKAVEDFEFRIEGEILYCKFKVYSIFGTLNVFKEVNI